MPKKPPTNRPIYKYMGLLASKMSIQLANIGTVQNKMGFFRPKFAAAYPKVRLAKIPAPAPSAAAQDASSIVIFPLANGLSSDVKIIVPGLLKPVPYYRLAVEK